MDRVDTRAIMQIAGDLPSFTLKQLWCAGVLGIIASAISAVLPAMLAVWQAQVGLSVSQSGIVAATELFAQVVGTGLFVWATRKRSYGTIAVVGLIGMVIGNLASAFSFSLASLIATRGCTGLAEGAVRALCMLFLGRALNPGRAFAAYAAGQVILAAGVTSMLPDLVSHFGPDSPFIVIALVSAIGFVFCIGIPGGFTLQSVTPRLPGLLPWPALLAVGGLFVYFLGQGALWTYLEPIGRIRGISASDITRALALLNLAGLVGALGVGALAYRLNSSLALLVLLITGLASLSGIFFGSDPVLFTVSVCGFYFAWCASFPFQFYVIAKSDPTGRASAVTPAVDGLGLAAGATLTGVLLPLVGLQASGWIYAASSILGIACYIVSGMMLNTRRSQADVSAPCILQDA